ncbi:outer membrane beta-barrel protein [Pelagicoccus sp. SDUM812005]|uniref:outer membrane beta-barrel protein n=1 Tax=Pelagicoccus sp. SDUM812005 TaxID=3041257 RepID=UPI00280C8267|nr:outer membrane beta-barrel protein [Pelagicoccus sp. SDUM812005]MDQ8182393.1 outer membrane beta-barrel protein [Pelagicoccus sp. SDUM812005]
MKPSISNPSLVAGALLCSCLWAPAAHSQTTAPTLSQSLSAPSAAPATSGQTDETNSSPRERGRILVKRNPIASEYQVFGDIGTSPGADADGEGVDFRAFFPRKNPAATPSDSLTLGYSLNFNDQSGIGKSGYNAALTKVLDPEGKWVLAAQYRDSASDRLIEHYESVWLQTGDQDTYYLDRPRFSFDEILTENAVATAQIGFRPNDRHEFYFKTSYQDYADDSYRNRIELQTGAGTIVEGTQILAEDNSTITAASFTDARTRRYFGDTQNQRTRLHNTFGGTYTGSDWTIDYSLYTQKWDLNTLWRNWNFRDTGIDLSYQIDDPYLPTITFDNDIDLQDTSGAAFSNLRIHNTYTRDRDAAARIDAERQLSIAGGDYWIQTGILHREKERNTWEDRKVYLPVDGNSFTLEQVAFESNGSPILSGAFTPPAGLSPAKSRAFIDNNPDIFVSNTFSEKVESAPQSYTAEEAVSSAYLLGTRKVGEWTYELGGRLERTETATRGTVVIPEAVNDPDEGDTLEIVRNPSSDTDLIIKDLYSQNSYTNFIPSAEVSYEASSEVTWRAAWFQLLMRPQYYNIVDYRRISIPTRSISEGNPELSPTEIDKLRLSWTKTNPTLGSLSIEGYLINIENFFYGSVSEDTILEEGDPVIYRVSRVENGDTANIKGVEIQWQKTVKDFALFDSATASIAYTYSDSEASVQSRPDDVLPTPERSEHLAKLSLSGTAGRFTSGIELSYQSEALDDLGSSYSQDKYREAVINLNARSSYRMDEKTSLGISLSNLTDHPERSYEGSPLRVTRNQYSSWFGTFNVTRSF